MNIRTQFLAALAALLAVAWAAVATLHQWWLAVLGSVLLTALLAAVLLERSRRQRTVTDQAPATADVTQLKQVELALRESQANLVHLFRLAPVPMAYSPVAPGTLTTYWNQAWYDTFGYPDGSKEGQTGDAFGFWCDPEQRKRYVRQLTADRHVSNMEVSLRHADGSERLCMIYGSLIGSGNDALILSTLIDITEQRASEHRQQAAARALEQSEARYRHLYDNMLEGFVVTDLQGKILTFNPSYRDMLGYTAEELQTKTFFELTPESWHDRENDLIEQQLKTRGYTDLFEKEYRAADGRVFPIELRAHLDIDASGQPTGFWAMVRDISERKRIEAAAELTRRQLLATLDGTPTVAVQWYDAEGRVLFWNPACEAMYGLTAQEMVGQLPVGTLYDAAGFQALLGVFEEIVRTGQPFGPAEWAMPLRDGRVVTVQATTFAIPMAEGKTGFVCMDVDISALKAAETTLQELNQTLEARVERRTADLATALRRLEDANTLVATNEKRLQAVLLATGEGVWDLNVPTGDLYNSPRWYEIMGLEDTSAVYHVSTFVQMLHPDDRDPAMAAVQSCLQGNGPYRSQHRMVRTDGTVMWVRDRGDVIEHDEQGQPLRMVGSVSDITAQKSAELDLLRAKTDTEMANAELSSALATLQRAQDELVRSEKLAALGSLVAGVAHELNTPIGNAVTVSSTVLDAQAKFKKCIDTGLTRQALRAFVETVGEAAVMLERNLQRAAELVNNFKQLAVDQSSHKRRPFLLHEAVEEVNVVMAPALRKARTAVHSAIPPDIRLDSYPGALTQALMILVNNAMVHAFEGREGGRIHIGATQPDPGWVRLTVQDDGSGIPEPALGRIFEPFFTTKLGQGGSGLGLHILFNIVTGVLGGRVTVDSHTGQGTTFTLTIPESPQTEPLNAFAVQP